MKLKQAWNSRGMRKLRRNRLAMFALGVIGLYLAVAIGVMFGLVTLNDTRERVLANETPGFFGSQTVDKRIRDATWLNDRLESGLRIATSSSSASDEKRFADLNDSVAMAERVVPDDGPFEGAAERIETAVGAFETLDEVLLDFEDLLDERTAIEDEIAELRVELRLAVEGGVPRPAEVARLERSIDGLESDVARQRGEIDPQDTEALSRLEASTAATLEGLRAQLAEASEPIPPDPELAAELEEGISEVQEELAEVLPLYEEASDARLLALDAVEAAQLEALPMPDGTAGAIYWIRTSLGGDEGGRSIAMKAIYSIKIAFQVGFVTAVVCVLLGTALGAAGAFYGGWVDYFVMFIVSVFSSIPSLVLLVVIRYIFSDSPLFDNAAEKPGLALVPVYAAFCLTFWIGTCRVVRGEVMKLKELEYVQAATAIGFGRLYILFKHVVPNTAHLMFINFSLLFIGAIKSEVILSFLNLGVKGQPSWGIMISNGKNDVTKFFFWDVLSATGFMFVLVLAFNILSDALQDAFDPKHVG